MAGATGMQPVEVVARFDGEGLVTPQRFTWQGREYRVDSCGRRWGDAAGLHFMVMTPGEQVYELIFVLHEQRWFLNPQGRAWV